MGLLLRPPGREDSLPEMLGDLGRFRRRVAVASGLFALGSVVLGCVSLVCLLDAAFGLPPLVRGLALVLTLTASGIVWLHGVARSMALRSDPLAVALELEERYPPLNDALASAVAFLEAGDADRRGVSNRLQEVVVRQARRASEQFDLGSIAPTGRCWRNGWLWGLLLTATAALAVADPGRAGTALVRFFDPFGNHPWPTRTRVTILRPEAFPARIPKGEPFELRFAVGGVIPERALVTIRVTGGEEFTEEYPLSAGNDPELGGAAGVVARIDAARLPSSFEFRVQCNDATSDWLRVEVVPPPRLVPLGGRPSPQVHVIPPAYTGLAPHELPDGAGVLEIPVGTTVRLRAATDVRLAAAALVYTGDRPALELASALAPLGHTNPIAAAAAAPLAEAVGRDIPLSLSPLSADGGGSVIDGTFLPSMSGMYALRLTDETGLTGTRLIEIRLVPDPSPTVTLLRPSVGRDPEILAPSASLTVRVAADDKVYAVRDIVLEYRVGRSGAPRTLPLLPASDAAGAMSAVLGGFGSLARVRPSTTEVQRLVPLTAFTRPDGSPLRDGDLLVLRGAADDWDDVTPAKPPGRSEQVEIAIASAEAIEAWLQRELAALRLELLRLREQQQEARQKAAEVKPEADGTLTPTDRDRLLTAEQTQRLVRGKLADPSDGLRAKATMLRETVRVNSLPRSNTTDRVETVAEELSRLTDRDLPVIEPALSDARQLGALPPRSGQEKALADLLRKATRHQKAVEDGLSDLYELLSVWGAAGDIRAEARVLRDALLRQIADLEKRGGTGAVIEPAEPIDLERATARAEQAAEQSNQLVGRATQLLAEKERQAAQSRADAEARGRDAARQRDRAATLPLGTPERSTAGARAAVLENEAEELRLAAAKTAAEAEALRAGLKAVGGQSLPDQLRKAATALRQQRPSEAATRLRSSAARLDDLIAALTEQPPETAPELAKKLKTAADDLDGLAAAQDELRQKAAAAARLTDPERRAGELRKLAEEQERLRQRGRDLLQRLNRQRVDDAARDLRAALDRMEAARGDLEAGETGMRAQNDAVDRLDSARDRLDAAADAAPRLLADEKRRKLADQVKAVLDKQKARIAEADRIHRLVASNSGWERDHLVSYGDLADAETELAREIRTLEAAVAALPVLARVVAEAARATDTAAERIQARRDDVDPTLAFDPELEAAHDRRVKRPMELAARRLEQLLEALQPDQPRPAATKADPTRSPSVESAETSAGGSPDLVDPLAQLKVLRALQAELNQRTAEFAERHPNGDRLTEEDREELKELEVAQREIARLFEQVARLFAPGGTGDDPAAEEPPRRPDQEPTRRPADPPPLPRPPTPEMP